MRLSPAAAVVAVLLGLSSGCTEPFQPARQIVRQPEVDPLAVHFPALSRAGEVYNQLGKTYFYAPPARFVLYQDNTFAVQALIRSAGAYGVREYPGRYSRAGSLIAFSFDGSSLEATGALNADSLSVIYGSNLNDFEGDFWNGVYVRLRQR